MYNVMPLSRVWMLIIKYAGFSTNSTAGARDNVLLLCLELAQSVIAEVQCIRNDLFRCGCNPLTESHVCG